MLEAPCKHLVPARLLDLQLHVRLHFAVHDMLLTRHLAVVGGLLITYDLFLQVPVRTSRLHLQLDGATPLHQAEDEPGLVHRVPDTQQAVAHQDSALVMLAQRLRNPLPLFASKHNPAIGRVDGVAVVQAAHILRDHVQRLGKDAPRPPGRRVRVAHGVDVRAAVVDGRVDVVAGLVARDGAGARVRPPADDAAGRDLHGDHVAGGEGAVVARQRVHPHDLGELRVAHRDVTGLAFGVAHARPVAEHGGHVDEGVPALGRVGWESGDV